MADIILSLFFQLLKRRAYAEQYKPPKKEEDSIET